MTDAALTSSAFRKTPRRRSPFMRKAFPYLLVAPAVVYLLAITLYPGIFALWRSFYTGRFKLEPVGFQNYAELFQDATFWHSLSNTVIIGGLTLFIEFVIALALAALVYRDRWVQGWRILFLLPMLFMPSAVAFLWKLLFNDGRIISDLLMRIGLVDGNIDFMGSTWLARMVLIVTDVWQWMPFLFIIFVAALQGQDKEIEEAARLDGARWRQIFLAHLAAHDAAGDRGRPGAARHRHPDDVHLRARHHAGHARPATPRRSAISSTARPSRASNSAMPRPPRWWCW